MTDSPHLVRKVRQLDNDVQAIYEMLVGIQSTQVRQGNRLDEIAAVVEAHTATLDGHTATLKAHGEKLDTVDTKLDEILSLLRR
ncbi:MAG: hypothetical protein ACT4O0_01935 [Pseudonocardia sp.]